MGSEAVVISARRCLFEAAGSGLQKVNNIIKVVAVQSQKDETAQS